MYTDKQTNIPQQRCDHGFHAHVVRDEPMRLAARMLLGAQLLFQLCEANFVVPARTSAIETVPGSISRLVCMGWI
jgi:hypothetical protein